MTQRITFLFTILFLVALPAFLLGQGGRQDPFSAEYSDDVIQVRPGEVFEFTLNFEIPKGFYLYDDKTSLLFGKTEDIRNLKSIRPPAEDYYDPFFKKNLKVHFKSFPQKVVFKVPDNAKPGRRTLEAQLKYQGCSSDFCYRPVKKLVLLPVEVLSAQAQIQAAQPPIQEIQGTSAKPEERLSFFELLQENNPELLLNQGRVYLLALALVGGILTSFTPCVLPIIPLTLAFIGVRHRRRGNLMRALMLVTGMVAMYSLLGFLAATLGLKLGFLFQQRIFVLLATVFFLIFSLGLFGVIPFHLPPKLHNKFAQMGGEGPLGSFVAGLTIGLIASPCVGPLIAPLLLIAAQTQDKFYGFFLLLNYGVGMGLLFLVLASGFAELNAKLKSGRWTSVLKKALAVLMLAPALYYGYAFAKPYLGPPKDSLWVYEFDKGIEMAQKSGKPVLLDYYADWCPPCIELDKRTFSKPEVRRMAENFVMLKIDCSFDDANCKKATKQYQVVGWPTVLFLQSDGKIIEDVNLVGGFADKEKMLALMEKALSKTTDQRPATTDHRNQTTDHRPETTDLN